MGDQVSPAERSPGTNSSTGLSIRYKLPLLICGLVLAATGLCAGAAYEGVRHVALVAARDRLNRVTGELSGALATSGGQLVKVARTAADQPDLAAFLRKPGPALRPKALTALKPMGPQPEEIFSVELYDAKRHRALIWSKGGPPVGDTLPTGLWASPAGPDSGAAGRFIIARDTMFYDGVAPVRDAAGVAGYLVQRRRLTSTAENSNRTAQVIGSGSKLFLGNDRQDVWSDLVNVAPPPPRTLEVQGDPIEYDRPGRGTVLALARAVPGAPWVVLLEFQRSVILQPATDFLRRLVVIVALVLVLGFAAAWVLSRNITTPLRRLTDTARAVTHGNLSSRVQMNRGDEFGVLADAFDTMAAGIEESQRRLEDRVKERTAELAERNEELEAFGYSISHDLRAPLRAMHGFSRILLEDHAEHMAPDARSFAERIVAAAERMDHLIRDLLDYGRVSRAQVETSPVELARVVNHTLAQLEHPLRASHAEVKVPEGLPAVVGHEATLAQAVTNLVANGIKFVPPGRMPEVRLRTERSNGHVRLWVEDNGIGISPEYHERVFRVFERLHTDEEYPGTGIGLAIVRKGVERMGGRVGLESTPGEGCRFWIELPSAEPAR